MPSRIQRCEPPNRIVFAIFGLLAVMAVSILVAIRFPYVDLNAQALLDAERAVVADNSGVVVAGGVGGGGFGVAHAPSDFEDGDIAETVGVGVGGAGSGGGVEADTIVDDLPAETKSAEDYVISDYVPIDATISVTESMGAPSQNNDDGNQGVVDGEVSSIESENGESSAINGNAGENIGTEITSINEEESTTPITDNSATNTANHGTVISESESNNYGGFFSATELDQLQELDISNLIGGGRKN